MANKMLIDATHPEETRVVVLRGNRVEEFDFESANRRQLRGNIYLAKVTRVEPSLQAAFVDYGGNRHGFLAFSEIHPDYYQIPVADRQALIAEEERAHRDAEDEIDRRASRRRPQREAAHARHGAARGDDASVSETIPIHEDEAANGEPVDTEPHEGAADAGAEAAPLAAHPTELPVAETAHEAPASETLTPTLEAVSASIAQTHEAEDDEEDEEDDEEAPAAGSEAEGVPAEAAASAEPEEAAAVATGDENNIVEVEEPAATENGEEAVESVGGADALEEAQERTPRYRRSYKIQEVIKRRQIMLVQVVKEERGTKGAALTTYLSLAGRYSVLMPNTARGGGISRKITNALDRKKLKEIAQELEVPEGMGVILRTAGANRTKTEVKRDFEYLLRMWETVRDLTLRSTAPTLVYEEGSLIKRSIRDLYNKDIEEILVAGDAGHREAKDFMRMLMPSHAKNVKAYHDTQPIFTRYGIESQLDAMFTPTVQLRSGGYIVINQTEALVAIDVNSGRATREHHIEDTATKTNVEAAEEIARQLRLRDLAGLIVIDFIDMDENRNNRTVERRLKEALKNDRARIQVGRISHFGLLEMSRQRIRSSVLESSTEKCPHCGGTGHVRSVSSVTLHLLRMIEEMLLKGATHNLIVRTRAEVALYVLNHKRAHLRDLESRFQITITVNADASVGAAQPFIIEKGEQVHSVEAAKALVAQAMAGPPPVADEEDEAEFEELAEDEAEDAEGAAESAEAEAASETAEAHGENGQRRRRRRRRGRGRDREREPREGGFTHETAGEHAVAHASDDEIAEEGAPAEGEEGPQARSAEPQGEGERRRRRRGRRGGRRNRRGREGEGGYAAGNGGTPESHAAHPHEDHADDSAEPEVADAVADLGGPIREETPAAAPHAAHLPQPFEPVGRDDAPVPPPAEPAASPEPPRRRSTVREPAPTFASAGGKPVAAAPSQPPAPAPEPPVAVPEPAQGEDAKPRRFGWWSKRG
ncbi:MAG TPA: Rne/Rng family ribonuclease [Xanthobacteraceae bacterium]|nr:Rne/Rng family ribonuclease [Xanthobacteraceae bacterium]